MTFISARIYYELAEVLAELDEHAPGARVVNGVVEVPVLDANEGPAVFQIAYEDGTHYAAVLDE